MSINNTIKQMMDEIKEREDSNVDDTRIVHEVIQQLALAGLYRGGFFEKASFYGGTCLRIIYGLRRFSEDLDFSLDLPDTGFDIEIYFRSVIEEFESLGLYVEITKKQKKTNTAIESAFLKSNTQVYDIGIRDEINVKIKLEVDTDPPPKFETEGKLVNLPFSYYAKCYTIPDLYAGKMHALIYRGWNNRVKGRDWYDFAWYVQRGAKLNLNHFAARVFQSEGEYRDGISPEEFTRLLTDKIKNTDIESAKKDVANFVYSENELDIWSEQFFLDQISFMKFLY